MADKRQVAQLLERLTQQMEDTNVLLRGMAEADPPVAQPLPQHLRKRTVRRPSGKRPSLVDQFDDLPTPGVLRQPTIMDDHLSLASRQKKRDAMVDVTGERDG